MTMVRPELIEELQQIVKEEYGLELSMSDTTELGSSLVEYFGILAKNNQKLPHNKYEHKTPSTTR